MPCRTKPLTRFHTFRSFDTQKPTCSPSVITATHRLRSVSRTIFGSRKSRRPPLGITACSVCARNVRPPSTENHRNCACGPVASRICSGVG